MKRSRKCPSTMLLHLGVFVQFQHGQTLNVHLVFRRSKQKTEVETPLKLLNKVEITSEPNCLQKERSMPLILAIVKRWNRQTLPSRNVGLLMLEARVSAGFCLGGCKPLLHRGWCSLGVSKCRWGKCLICTPLPTPMACSLSLSHYCCRWATACCPQCCAFHILHFWNNSALSENSMMAHAC